MHADVDVVKLADGELRHVVPRLGAIVGDGKAAIVAFENPPRVGGVNPHRLMITVDTLSNHLPRSASVGGQLQVVADAVEPVRIVGIDAKVGVVEGPVVQARVVVDERPGLTVVV